MVLQYGRGAILLFVVTHLQSVSPFQPSFLHTTRITSTSVLHGKKTNFNFNLSNHKTTPVAPKAKKLAPNFNLKELEAFEKSLETPVEPVPRAESTTIQLDTSQDDASPDAVKTYTIPESLHLTRIDQALSTLDPKLSRSSCGTLISSGSVFLQKENGFTPITRKAFKVEEHQTIRVQIDASKEPPTVILAQNIPLEILFEDEHMIAVNKPAGIVVHPAVGNWDGTLVNALAYYFKNVSPHGKGEFAEGALGSVDGDDEFGEDKSATFRPGIVHRLDKGTTGVIVVAKTEFALAALSASFQSRTVKKTYVAVTIGNPGKKVVIDKPIGRHPLQRQKMRVVPDPTLKNSSGIAPVKQTNIKGFPVVHSASVTGRKALSFVDTKAFDGKLSVVEVRIETGRTHQIRVHLADRHTPVYGDDVYGIADWNRTLRKKLGIERPLLHAHRLEVDHPVTGERLVIVAKMKEDMEQVVDSIWPQGREERADLFEDSVKLE